MVRIGPIAALCGVCLLGQVVAGEMQPPRITRAAVDWDSAVAALSEIPSLRALNASADAKRAGSVVGRLNAASAEQFAGIASSPVPVLLPFDVDAYLRDRAAGQLPDNPDQAYSFGFGRAAFFDPGPAGYDATFRFGLADIPELADIHFSRDANIAISASLLTYELDPPPSGRDTAVPALEADFPGIRRVLSEEYVRYTFVRFGVPYVVAIDCFDGPSARGRHMACRDADRVVQRFIRSLRIAGGAPPAAKRAIAPAAAPAADRPAAASPTFTYYGPGQLVPGTGFRGNSGRADDTVYSAIRFPLGEAPAFVGTQYFHRRVAGGNLGYPWRDNFCESRSFHVGQCPGGMGHQGEDIRAAPCSSTSAGDDRCSPHHDDVVAARDGMILRAAGQEAVYLVVNTPTEHIRFRYLHMRPKALDANGIVSGRKIAAGEVFGRIGNYDGHEHGTSYHLHFDIQVPTRNGWVFVNPYMTLVAAYERLIGGRGAEVPDTLSVVAESGEAPSAITLADIRQAMLIPIPAGPAEASPHARFAEHCAAHTLRHGHRHGCERERASAHSLRYGHHVRSAAAVLPHRLRRRHHT